MFQPVTFILRAPRPVSLLFVFANRPDDDVALAINGRLVLDRRRNLGWYTDNHWAYTGPMEVADRVEVFTFDGWAGGWANYPWSLQIGYQNGESTSFTGGEHRTGTSLYPNPGTDPNYYSNPPRFSTYYPNGSFLIPPPPRWPCPDSLKFGNTYSLASSTKAVK